MTCKIPMDKRVETEGRSRKRDGGIPMPYATEENLTELALKQWEACHTPRLREIMQSLVKHLHGFVREVDLTGEEWMTAMNWLVRTGKMSTEKRHEFIL